MAIKQGKTGTGKEEGDRATLASLPFVLPALDQIVLRLAESPTFPLPIDTIELTIAPSVLSAMQRLVEIVVQLQSTASSEGVDRSPEALALYVFEEAQDVLDALQAEQSKPSETFAQPVPLTEHRMGQGYLRLSSLVPWLLWGTVRSSDAVMQLLEGYTARCLQPDQTWQTGILRLVPLLRLYTADTIHSIDLATGLPFVNELAIDRIVQFDSTLGQSSVAVADLLSRLNQQIQTITPALTPFLQKSPAELFVPRSPWQAGAVQLHYALEFTPLSPAPLPLLPPLSALPRCKFTDSVWLEQYQTLIVQQQLRRFLSLEIASPGEPSLTSLVATACQAAEQLQTGLAITSRRLVREELSLSQLAMRLHWGLIHSAYEVMQLLSGIRATVWMPESAYQTGTLRFLVYLSLQTPESEWVLDLATGEILTGQILMGRSPLPAQAIVQSAEHVWCQQPSQLAQLEKILWQQVHQAIPEIKLWLQGTEIDLCNPDLCDPDLGNPNQEQQPGAIRLRGGFEFEVGFDG